MKKKNLIFAVAICSLSLAFTGCSTGSIGKKTQTITCSDDEQTMTMVYNNKNKQFESGSLTMTQEIEESQVETYKSMDICSYMDTSSEDSYYKDCESSIDGTTLKITIGLDLDKLEASDESDGFKKSMTVDEFKKLVEEDDDVKCTVK